MSGGIKLSEIASVNLSGEVNPSTPNLFHLKIVNSRIKSSSSSVISFLLRPVRVNILLVHIFIST